MTKPPGTATIGFRQIGHAKQYRVAVLIDGRLDDANKASTFKNAAFVEALQHRFITTASDMMLRNWLRLVLVLAVFRPNRRIWAERYRKNPLTFVMRSLQTRRLLRRMEPKPDVVLQVGALSNPYVDSMPFALYLDFTFALTNREWPARVPMTRAEQVLWRRLELRVYQQAALIFTRSAYTARSLRIDYGIPETKIHAIGAGVNLPLPDIEHLPTRTEPHVLFIGTDFERKGGDVLLAAWLLVLEQHPHARLTLIGRAPASSLPGVSVVHERADRMTVVRALSEASMFVMPSRCETWGDVFLEAMAYGLPCIGTTADAMPEIIQDGVTGYLVPPGESVPLARAIVSLIEQPVLAQAMGRAGRKRLEHQFLWSHVVEQMASHLENLAIRGATSS